MMSATYRAIEWTLGLLLLVAMISVSLATDRVVVLKLGVSSMLLLDRPYETILTGDPDVVDVARQSDRSVILRPLNAGTTNVIFLDDKSMAIANIGILVCRVDVSRIHYQDGSGCEQPV